MGIRDSTDSLPGLALGVDKNDRKLIMHRPPRDPNESLFAEGGLPMTLFYGALIAAITLAGFLFVPVRLLLQQGEAVSIAAIDAVLADPELLEEGQSEFWELAGESRDVIVFRALPFRDSGVALRLFRDADDGSAVAAIGTLGTELCTVELWRVDASGRTVPVDVPQEPDIQEFFAKGQPVPDDVNPSVLICLGMGGLRAHPVFWNKTGMLYLPLANEIGYRWDGHRFQKVVRPHAEGSGEPADGLDIE